MSLPTDKPRWAELGLADPPADGRLPEQGQTADLLAFAVILPGAEDPVIGIVDAVALELHALSQAIDTDPIRDVLFMLGRRLEVAMLLLRRADGRAPMPREFDPDAETQTESPDEGEGGA